ncbi:PREDICTED: transient receptor potential protein [Dufourea novaeangliae]|uniref:Transient receptor potential protein n=1 Tax=Dufourea novaeangliae TaxID=178035 RepID=A0A154PFZ3_DUFNO|nr:PREDICTED: transient receptor potential protein [Dufourea novaeangliae]KZC10761.1 Transient receptor potential protein [Dufourea novaeangliae]
MNPSESQQNLLANETRAASMQSLTPPQDYCLGPVEKHFLLSAERGDCATVKRLLEENKDHPELLNIDCVDPLNRSALIAAIENENIDLIKLLLDLGIQVKDALLHAIKEEYVEAVEILLEWEEKNHAAGQPYSWEAVDRSSSNFTPDITPLILAAHKNNYEILKILLDRGATLPTPHDARCGCDECVTSSEQDSLRHSQARINAYRALTSPSLIALSSRDPLLTAFELSWELRRLSKMEQEFRFEYNEMREQTQTFATSLLDHARTSLELEIMLNYNPHGDNWEPGERQTLDRLKLAIKYKQKQFVAHPNVQQLLAAIWYDGLPGFRRKSMIGQFIEVGKLGAMFPVYSSIYMVSPTSPMGLFMKKPFVKFICHSSSYAFFLMLLGMASQRIEYLVIELFGNAWMHEILAGWKRRERGCIPGFVESGVIIYVISLVMGEMRSLWSDGLLDYISDLWNIVDFIQNVFYVIWIMLRLTAFIVVQREYWNGMDPWYPRDQWHAFDPMLLSEGAFAAGMIFSFLKLVHIFSVNPHLGPLQISLGRMIIDIIKFFFIYTLVLFAFGCGMNQLMWYYADLEKMKCYNIKDFPDLPNFDDQEKACSIWRRFANLFETSQSLFWASFGMIDLMSFDLTGIKSFTRFWALLMFGSYSVINVIVLLNMLIAMMSNSYQIISERADTEWKFARSHLWMSYFEDGDTVPPPFNMIPTGKTFNKLLSCSKSGRQTRSLIKKSREKALARHETVMRLLIRRYVTAEQRKRDEFGITEDDVMEIRQDISTLRYELIDILRQNGMKTPSVDKQDAALSGKKGRVMERRLQKDFQIGIVEGIVNAVIQNENEPKDVFSQIAKAIGRKSSGSKKKDWNAMVRKNTLAKDPIGSTTEASIKQTRRSIRRHLQHQANSDLASMDPTRLLDYNPNLSEVTPVTRIAYAKFMMSRTKVADEDPEAPKEEGGGGGGSTRVSIMEGGEPVRAKLILKKSLLKSASGGSMDKDKTVEKVPSTEGKPEVRTPSPIPEDPREDDATKSPQGKSSATKKPTETSQPKKEGEDKKKGDEKKVEGDDKNVDDEEKKKKEEEEKKKKEEEEKKKKEEEEKKKKEEEKKKEPGGQAAKPSPQEDNVPVATTKLRGKSKATGQIMGGWI